MLRQDRMRELVALVEATMEAVPDAELLEAMPAPVATSVKLLRRFRVDLLADVRRSVMTSAQALPDQCSRDPERAQRILDRTIGLIAWLDDQTDEPPALSLS